MAITFVQQVAGSDQSEPLTLAISPTAGNSLIAVVAYSALDSGPQIFLDVGGLFALAVSKTGSIISAIYYLHDIPSGIASIGFDTNSELGQLMNVSEWSGLNNAAPTSTNNNSGTASSTVTTGSVTPTTTNNLVIGSGAWTADDYSSGPTNGFTRLTAPPAVFFLGASEGAYINQTAITTKSTGWGLSAGIDWAATIAVFGSGAPPPTGRTSRLSMMGVS